MDREKRQTLFLLDQVPFSTYGSYFVISLHPEEKEIYLREIRGGGGAASYLYRIEPDDHTKKEYEVLHLGSELRLESRKIPGGYVSFVPGTKDDIYIRTEGMGVKLICKGAFYDTLAPLSADRFEHHVSSLERKHLFTCLSGRMMQQQDWNVMGSRNVRLHMEKGSQVRLESYRTVPSGQQGDGYDKSLSDQESSWKEWLDSFPDPAGKYEKSRILAAYITWMNFVHADGFLKADAMYMSKTSMCSIWSWDNCFGAIALSPAHPEQAFGQMKIFLELQDESGCYPDLADDGNVSYSFVKPPIHGWAYKKMLQKNPSLKKQEWMEEMYESLVHLTHYWLYHRRSGDAVYPLYYHGNDSGWDNASIFRRGMPVESPDLAAFLIFQMDFLSDLAGELGKEEEAEGWKKEADQTYSGFLDRFYENGRFYAIYAPEQEKIREGNSLLMYLPLLIGYRLGKEITSHLTAELLRQFETPYGLATEAPDSPFYTKGGYWLGPVWAPTSYLFIDILRRNGDLEAAERLKEKFCRLTEVGLLSENYDPFTGEANDEPAFAWPSCVLLTLLSEEKNVSLN